MDVGDEPKVEASYGRAEDPIEKAMDYQLKQLQIDKLKPDVMDGIIKLEQIRQMRQGGGSGGDPEVKTLLMELVKARTEDKQEAVVAKLEAKIERLESDLREPSKRDDKDLMDRAQEAMMAKAIFRDEGGAASNGTAVETVTELEVVKDAKGNDVTDEAGSVITPPARVVRRPVTIQGGPSQAAPVDELDRMMDKMTRFQMMRMMAQGMGGGFGATAPGMVTIQEPVLNEKGEIVLDSMKQPVMRIRTEPVTGGGQRSEVTAKDMIDTTVKIAEIMRPKEESGVGMLTQMMMKRIDQMGDSQIKMLSDQVGALQNQDPLGYVSDIVDKLKKIGAFGTGKEGQSLEVAKLSTDLEKWEFDKDQEFKRWAYEQRQNLEDKKYSRKQLEEFGKTLREGIEKVAAPVAQGFKEGYVETAKRGKNGAAPRQERQSADDKLEKMSDEELVAQPGRLDQAEDMIGNARKNVIAEMNRRGLKV